MHLNSVFRVIHETDIAALVDQQAGGRELRWADRIFLRFPL